MFLNQEKTDADMINVIYAELFWKTDSKKITNRNKLCCIVKHFRTKRTFDRKQGLDKFEIMPYKNFVLIPLTIVENSGGSL